MQQTGCPCCGRALPADWELDIRPVRLYREWRPDPHRTGSVVPLCESCAEWLGGLAAAARAPDGTHRVLGGPSAGNRKLGGAIGYCPQTPGLFDLLTAEDHLVMFGRGSGLGRAESLRRGYAALEEFGYPMHERTVVADLSGGTRQKLNLALALLTDPSVLLLDEPYQGFDRGTYVNFWDHCETWRRAGKSVVVVTHMLAELDRVDRVVELPAHPSRAHHPGW